MIDGEIAYVGQFPVVRAVDLSDGSILWDVDFERTPYDVALGPDGETLFATAHSLIAIDTEDGEQEWDVDSDDEFGDRVYELAPSPDGESLAAGLNGPSVHLLDADTGSELWSADIPTRCRGLEFSPDGETLFVTDREEPAVIALSAEDGSEVWSQTFDEALEHMGISPDGETLTVSDDEGNLYALDPEDGESRWEQTGYDGGLKGHAFHPGRGLVYVGYSSQGTHMIYGFDLEDGSTAVEESMSFEIADRFAISPNVEDVDGGLQNAMAYDAESGEEIELANGVLEIEAMYDRDGEEVLPFDRDEMINALEDETGEDIDTLLEDVDGIDEPEDIENTSDVAAIIESRDDVESSDELEVEIETVGWDRPEYDETDMEAYREYLEEANEEYADALADRENGDDDDPIGAGGFFDDFSTDSMLGLGIIAAVVLVAISVVSDAIPILGD